MPCFVFHTSYFWHFCSTLLFYTLTHTFLSIHLFHYILSHTHTYKSPRSFHIKCIITKCTVNEKEWASKRMSFIFLFFAFKTSYSISLLFAARVIFNDSTLFTVGRWLPFFLYEMCARVSSCIRNTRYFVIFYGHLFVCVCQTSGWISFDSYLSLFLHYTFFSD